MNLQTINEALVKIREHGANADKEYEATIKAATKLNKEIYDLDMLLKQIGAKIALTAMSGNHEALEALKNKALLLSAKKADLLKAAGVSPAPD